MTGFCDFFIVYDVLRRSCSLIRSPYLPYYKRLKNLNFREKIALSTIKKNLPQDHLKQIFVKETCRNRYSSKIIHLLKSKVTLIGIRLF